ncbi:Uncharacterized protein AC509_4862 [Pseudomonas amygdali pv. morsprunorum]|uniref:Uncharacterized protein n=1 Tax=Pseudomonas amygdali pv. mori TaxID=34065 RepID=A0A0N8S6Z5_PSEA0|nr:Uncharacterized protein AC509_4862 [Pseudomonas amygdali pv. morsprunorum]KPX97367.1 hypothetical protein ALO63_102590 [Pseudomonas amygdali pv. mori]
MPVLIVAKAIVNGRELFAACQKLRFLEAFSNGKTALLQLLYPLGNICIQLPGKLDIGAWLIVERLGIKRFFT